MKPYDYYISPDEYDRAAAIGVSRQCLSRRVRAFGWDKNKALTTPPRKFHLQKKYIELAIQNGIRYGTFNSRVYALGWSHERAATEFIRTKSFLVQKMITKNRIYPEEMIELAAKNGVKYCTFRYRIKYLKWDIVKAATVPIKRR
jgi:hypothetical protein